MKRLLVSPSRGKVQVSCKTCKALDINHFWVQTTTVMYGNDLVLHETAGNNRWRFLELEVRQLVNLNLYSEKCNT